MDKKTQEKELLELGFKRKWLSDRSGYWFEYRPKNKNVKFVVDINFKQFELQTDFDYEDKPIKIYSSLKSLLNTIKVKNIW